MSKQEPYQWQGREDTEDGQKGLRWHQVVNQPSSLPITTLVGFECDIGVANNKGRIGAVDGPNAIRNALANLAWHAECGLRDSGSIRAENGLAEAQTHYANQIADSLNSSLFVIGLGGGHEIAWGSYQGLAKHLSPEKKIGIINFDAHFDLRKPKPTNSSGTPFRQIAEHCNANNQRFHYACLGVSESANTQALFDYAQQSGTRYLLDLDCEINVAKDLLEPMLKEIDQLYVTICMDAFPANMAPGVSAPSALGILHKFVIKLIHWLAESQSLLNYQWNLADIAEMNPHFDIDNRTAKLAARLIYEMIKAKYHSDPQD